MTKDRPATGPAREAGGSKQGGMPRIVDLGALLGTEREVIISHGEERYRLRLTQNGKLLLTK